MEFTKNNNENTEESREKNTQEIETIEIWDNFDLCPNLLRGIYAYGFEKPSPIQSKAIKPIIEKNDVIAQAQSGTGKTGAFTVSALQLIDEEIKDNQVIIMSPTRELAIQTKDVLSSIGTFLDYVKVQLLIGGTSVDKDIESLKNKPTIIVGCPGRIHDMIKRKKINTKTIKLLILDEADEMLSAGFKEQVYDIFQYLTNNLQVCLFSATLPNDVQYLSEKFMRNPIKILVKTEALTLEGINQYYIALEDDNSKFETLKDLFKTLSVNQTIIYCNSIKRVTDLTEALNTEGFSVSCIHSNMEKEERTQKYYDFKSGGSRILISTNLTARGIDVQQVSIVVNFDIPKDVHSYLHRIGRSGRWGRKGTGINFITKRDVTYLRDIEKFYSTEIQELPSSFVN